MLKKSPARTCIVVAAMAAAATLAGCGVGNGSASGRPQVVVSFYPLQYLAERIAGEHADITTLTAPGQEPHDLELSASKVAKVADADLVVYERGLQAAVDDAIDTVHPTHAVDVAKVVDLVPMSQHDIGLGSDEGEGEGLDPHFWQDPQRYKAAAQAVYDGMADIDPAHEADYESHLQSLTTDLDQLDQEFTTGLANCQRHTVVVSHDAFGYLGDRYNLDLRGIAGLSPDAEPSPAHIAALHKLIEDAGITTVFNEELASPKMAQTLAHDLGLTTKVLSPIEGLTDATSNEDYLSLMRANLAALRQADACM